MAVPRFITCKEFIDFVWAYLSDEVTRDQRELFEYHLTNCPSCVAYMKTYRITIALGKEAFTEPEAPVPDEVPEELVQAILDAKRKGS